MGKTAGAFVRSVRGRAVLLAVALVAAAVAYGALAPGPVQPPPHGAHRVERKQFACLDGSGVYHEIRAWSPADMVAPNSLPVLLFSPGLGEQPDSYSALLSDVASSGYAVLAIPHRKVEVF